MLHLQHKKLPEGLLTNIKSKDEKSTNRRQLNWKPSKLGNKCGCKDNILWAGEKIVDEGIKHAPDLYTYRTTKIKNKEIQRALNSDIAN